MYLYAKGNTDIIISILFLLGFKPVRHCGVSQEEKRSFEEQINHLLCR